MLDFFKLWLSGFYLRLSVPGASAPALVGPAALALILDFEGLDQPWARPPGDSGITIGHGFDLGYCTAAEFDGAWTRHLPAADMPRLRRVIGKKGAAAEAVAAAMREVRAITRGAADEVFLRCTLPQSRALATRTFPGLHVLSPDQQGVLVSLVLNRGGSLSGATRREMLEIANILKAAAPVPDKARYIAGRILLMRRLWPDIPGLIRRRTAEARLMAPGIPV